MVTCFIFDHKVSKSSGFENTVYQFTQYKASVILHLLLKLLKMTSYKNTSIDFLNQA